MSRSLTRFCSSDHDTGAGIASNVFPWDYRNMYTVYVCIYIYVCMYVCIWWASCPLPRPKKQKSATNADPTTPSHCNRSRNLSRGTRLWVIDLWYKVLKSLHKYSYRRIYLPKKLFYLFRLLHSEASKSSAWGFAFHEDRRAHKVLGPDLWNNRVQGICSVGESPDP